MFPQDFAEFLRSKNGSIIENVPCIECDETHLVSLDLKNSVVLLRGNISPLIYDVLEKNKILHTPKRKAKEMADDKFLTFSFFSHKIKMAKTEKKTDFDFLQKSLKLPFVAKPRFGSLGRGVFLVNSKEEFDSIDKTNYIFQEFIETRIKDSKPKDFRLFVCNGKILASVQRIGSENSILSNISQGGFCQKIEIPEQLKEIALFAIKKAGLFYGSVDFLFDGEKFYLCEINASPGFEGLEKSTNSFIAEEIVDSIVRNSFLL